MQHISKPHDNHQSPLRLKKLHREIIQHSTMMCLPHSQVHWSNDEEREGVDAYHDDQKHYIQDHLEET